MPSYIWISDTQRRIFIFQYKYVLCKYLENKLDMGFPGGSDGKKSVCNVENPGSIPGSGWSHGEWNGHPLQYSCLENSMDRGAWQAVQSMGLQRVRHDWETKLSLFPFHTKQTKTKKTTVYLKFNRNLPFCILFDNMLVFYCCC